MDFNTENHYLMKYDSVTVHGSVCVMDCQWSDSVPELCALEVTECYEEAGNQWIALLSPLPSADLSGSALLYYGMEIFPWACVISSQHL